MQSVTVKTLRKQARYYTCFCNLYSAPHTSYLLCTSIANKHLQCPAFRLAPTNTLLFQRRKKSQADIYWASWRTLPDGKHRYLHHFLSSKPLMVQQLSPLKSVLQHRAMCHMTWYYLSNSCGCGKRSMSGLAK